MVFSQDYNHFNHCKEYNYIYKINTKIAEQVLGAKTYGWDNTLKGFLANNNPVDSVKICAYKSLDDFSVRNGLYLVIQPNHDEVNLGLFQKGKPNLNTFTWKDKFYVQPLKNDKLIEQSSIFSKKRTFSYNSSRKAFEIDKKHYHKKIKGERIYVVFEKDTFIYNAYSEVWGVKNARAKSKRKAKKVERLQKIGWYNYKKHKFNPQFGFLAISQPKYRIGDTLKAQVVLFRKKGKGYNDSLNITLKRGYYGEKIDINQFKTTLKKGVIEINYPLEDSLNLSSYILEVSSKKGKRLFQQYVSLEDYELPEYKVQTRLQSRELFKGEPIVFFGSLKDYNGFNAFGSYVKIQIRLNRLDSFERGVVEFKRDLEAFKKPLEDFGETRFEIPIEEFQGMSGNIEVKVTFIAPGSFIDERNLYVQINSSQNSLVAKTLYHQGWVEAKGLTKDLDSNLNITVTRLNGSELVIQKKLGEKFLGKSDWMSFRANWNGMKTETSFHNPNFNQALEYRIVKDSIEVNIDTSVFKEATLNVFEKELLIKSVTNLPSLLKLPNNKEGYTIKCIHDWKGKTVITNKNIDLKRKNELIIKGDSEVYPHKTTSYELTTINKKGKPEEGVDLVAYAYNDKFNNTNTYNILYPRKSSNYTLRTYNPSISPAVQSINSSINEETIDEFKLRHSEFYKNSMPYKGFKLEEIHVQDTNCYFEPHLYSKGIEIAPNYVLVNGKFHFTEFFSNSSDWPIAFNDSIQPLIRVGTNYFKLHGYLKFKKGIKYVVRINVDEETPFFHHLNSPNYSLNKEVRAQKRAFQEYESKYLFDHTVLLHFEKFCDKVIIRTRNKAYEWDNVLSHWLFKLGPDVTDSVWVTTMNQWDTLNYVWKNRKGILHSLGEGRISYVPMQRKLFSTKFLNKLNVFKSENDKQQPENIELRIFNGIGVKIANNTKYQSAGVYQLPNNKQVLVLKTFSGELYKTLPFSKPIEELNEVYVNLEKELTKISTLPQGGVLKKVLWNSEYEVSKSKDELDSRSYSYYNKMPSIWVYATNEFNKKIDGAKIYSLKSKYNYNAQGHRANHSIKKSFIILAKGYTPCVISEYEVAPNTSYHFHVTLRKEDSLNITPIQIHPNRMEAYSPWDFNNAGVNYSFNFQNAPFWVYSNSLVSDNFSHDFNMSYQWGVLNKADSAVVLSDKLFNSVVSSNEISPHRRNYKTSHNFRYFRGDVLEYDDVDKLEEVMEEEEGFSSTYTVTVSDSNGCLVLDAKESSKSEENNISLSYGDTLLKRTDFRDNAFWKSNLTTDENGKVKFETTFPDDITQWHMQVVGWSPKGELYTESRKIKSYKPVVANIDFPRFIVEGDEFQALGKCMNYTSDKYEGKTEFFINGESQNKNTISLDKIHLDSVTINNIEDTVKIGYKLLLNNEYWDAEERELPVHKKGIGTTTETDYFLSKDTSLSIQLTPGEYQIQLASGWNNYLKTQIKDLKSYPYACTEQLTSKLLGMLVQYDLSKKVDGADVKKGLLLKSQINTVIRKLAKRSNSEYMWGWWNNGSTHEFITAYLIEVIKYAHDLQFNVRKLNEMNPYILNRILQNDELNNEIRLYAACQIAELETKKMKDFAMIAYQKPKNKAQVVLLNKLKQLTGEKIDMAAIDSIASFTKRGGKYWEDKERGWIGNRGFLTRQVYQIKQLAHAKQSELNAIAKTVWYLNSNKHHTLQKAQFLLMAKLHQPEVKKGYLKYNLGASQSDLIQSSDASVFGKVLSIKIDSPIELKIKSKGTFGFVSVQKKEWKKPEKKGKEDVVEIDTEFLQKEKKATKLIKTEQYTLKVKIHVKNETDYVRVEVPIPAGLTYKNKNSIQSNDHIEYYKDKVVLYYEHVKKGDIFINVPLTARYKGKYTINPVKFENMYFPNISGWNVIKSISVN